MREIIPINENWTLSFPKWEHSAKRVTLTHTWNAADGMDGNGSYLRTTAPSATAGRLRVSGSAHCSAESHR